MRLFVGVRTLGAMSLQFGGARSSGETSPSELPLAPPDPQAAASSSGGKTTGLALTRDYRLWDAEPVQ